MGRIGKTGRFDIGSTKRLFCQCGIKEVHEEARCRKKGKNYSKKYKGRKSTLRGREGSARGNVVMVRALSGSGHSRSKIQVFWYVMQCH